MAESEKNQVAEMKAVMISKCLQFRFDLQDPPNTDAPD